MGCTASKLDNEDTVRRCKDRRRYMKDAVYARHHLAAAHSDYCRSLRLTGSMVWDRILDTPKSAIFTCLRELMRSKGRRGSDGRNRTLDDVWVVDVAEDLDFTADLTADGVFVVAVNDGGGGGDDGDQFRRR
ncbi:hypothetical protein Vadar_016362 [Vaccinium darrowii]|uniref:Uncharacterized protein n=1 Tax=Vaccinium darrowii TaxID=229202 RepID=A0ACB7Y762_9ERIC|nr:hypothetical protein Vadar_016362 [Vaccinium darrowii]